MIQTENRDAVDILPAIIVVINKNDVAGE